MTYCCGLFVELCPKGDDPLTPRTGYITLNITTWARFGVMTGGWFLFTLNGQSTSFPADASSWNSSACHSTFKSLRNLASVNCSRTALNHYGGGSYILKFSGFSSIPFENNLYSFDGSIPTLTYSCVGLAASAGSSALVCDINDITPSTVLLPGKLLMHPSNFLIVFEW